MTPYQKLVWLAQEGKCFYCDGRMRLKQGSQDSRTRDHFFPLSKGKSVGGNVVFACLKCNQQKAGREPTLAEFARFYLLRKRVMSGMPKDAAQRVLKKQPGRRVA